MAWQSSSERIADIRVGIELSPEYVRLIERRCAQNALDFTEAVNE